MEPHLVVQGIEAAIRLVGFLRSRTGEDNLQAVTADGSLRGPQMNGHSLGSSFYSHD